jgi:hypothetical protein
MWRSASMFSSPCWLAFAVIGGLQWVLPVAAECFALALSIAGYVGRRGRGFVASQCSVTVVAAPSMLLATSSPGPTHIAALPVFRVWFGCRGRVPPVGCPPLPPWRVCSAALQPRGPLPSPGLARPAAAVCCSMPPILQTECQLELRSTERLNVGVSGARPEV